MSRISPLCPPYDDATADQPERMMPPVVPPILLFRTFPKNLPMSAAMGGWGSYELSRDLSITMRDREIVIDRTCARCQCEYEWGVHVAFFAERCGLDQSQVASLTHGSPSDSCWTDDRDRFLISAVDSLHDNCGLADATYKDLATVFDEAQVLDILLLCGWFSHDSVLDGVALLACGGNNLCDSQAIGHLLGQASGAAQLGGEISGGERGG